MGNLIVMGLISMGLLPKAILEAVHFKDRKAAKQTLGVWLISFGSLCLAFGLTLLLNHAG